MVDPDTVALVKEFFQNDEVSCQMPGKRDFVSVKIDGRQTHVPKFFYL